MAQTNQDKQIDCQKRVQEQHRKEPERQLPKAQGEEPERQRQEQQTKDSEQTSQLSQNHNSQLVQEQILQQSPTLQQNQQQLSQNQQTQQVLEQPPVKGSKGFNPFVDWSFKHLFAIEKNKGLMISLLNVILEGEEMVKNLTYINTVNIPEDENGRGCIFDVLCENENGDKFLVEMQNCEQTYIN